MNCIFLGYRAAVGGPAHRDQVRLLAPPFLGGAPWPGLEGLQLTADGVQCPRWRQAALQHLTADCTTQHSKTNERVPDKQVDITGHV